MAGEIQPGDSPMRESISSSDQSNGELVFGRQAGGKWSCRLGRSLRKAPIPHKPSKSSVMQMQSWSTFPMGKVAQSPTSASPPGLAPFPRGNFMNSSLALYRLRSTRYGGMMAAHAANGDHREKTV